MITNEINYFVYDYGYIISFLQIKKLLYDKQIELLNQNNTYLSINKLLINAKSIKTSLIIMKMY